MKHSGIVRNLDEVGRLTLPMEMRRALDISEGDPIEITREGGRIILNKYQSCDIFDGETTELIEFCGKKVSVKNIKKLAKRAGLIE